MKLPLFFITLVLSMSLQAQSLIELEIKKTIQNFFEAFHKQDTLQLKTFAKGNITMQSVSINKDGKTVLTTENYNTFLRNIAGIPKENKFEEKLIDFKINVDGNMATAWTPYEFWYKGNFSHCGVNSFQLIKENKTWKIIYLLDSRRRNGCIQKNPN